MATHEVTWELWYDVRNWALNHGHTDIGPGGGKGATRPVHTVSWWDVVKWCNARSEREGVVAVYRYANGTVFQTGTTAPIANWASVPRVIQWPSSLLQQGKGTNSLEWRRSLDVQRSGQRTSCAGRVRSRCGRRGGEFHRPGGESEQGDDSG